MNSVSPPPLFANDFQFSDFYSYQQKLQAKQAQSQRNQVIQQFSQEFLGTEARITQVCSEPLSQFNFINIIEGTIPNYKQQQYQPQKFVNSLYGCCKEPHTCCCVFLCPVCFYPYFHGVSLQNAKKKCQYCLFGCLLSCLCVGFLNRLQLRDQYNIDGDLLEDCAIDYCCCCCSVLQMYYESKDRK